MKVEMYSGTIISIPFDRHKIDARFHHIATHKEHLDEPVIVRLHGILGNLLDETEHFLPEILAKKGYSSITINTVLANLGLFFGFGIFDDTIKQIDAVCDFLRGVGFKKIVIAGHGLGGCMAVRYAAMRNDPLKYPDIVGVITIATPYSIPHMTQRRWKRFGSEPTYKELHRKAKNLFHPGSGDEAPKDEIVVIRRSHGKTRSPEDTEIYTLKTWWSLAGPEAEGPKTYKHIGHIKVPVLIIHGLKDEFVEQREFTRLVKIARDAGNKDVTHICLDAAHTFKNKHEDLAKVIIKWLNQRFGNR